jgi:hypothetical protein
MIAIEHAAAVRPSLAFPIDPDSAAATAARSIDEESTDPRASDKSVVTSANAGVVKVEC